MAAAAALSTYAPALLSDELQFGNLCVHCGNDSLPEQAYCSSICELQDTQGATDSQYLVPGLVSGGRSTGSSSSVCSTPNQSPHASPANALGNIDELTAEISNFNLPPSVLGVSKAALPIKSLNFDYGYAQKKLDAIEDSPSAAASPSFLGHLYSRSMIKNRSNNNVKEVFEEGSPTTPTENILRFQRNPAQLPAAPRRESRGLLSPQLKPVNPSSFDQSLIKTGSGKNRPSLSIDSHCGKPGCPSLHSPIRPSMPSARRPSAPLARSRLFVSSSDEDDADSERSSPVPQRRARSRKRSNMSELSLVDGTKGKRSESAHALGAGVCSRFKPDLARRKTGFVLEEMTPLELGESAVKSGESSSEEDNEDLKNRGRERTTTEEMSTERGRSKKREGPAASRRSKSRHREFSR